MNKRQIWLIIIPLVLFAALAVCVQSGLTASVESWAYQEAVQPMSPTLTSICKLLSDLGNKYSITVFCLLLVLIPKARRTIALPVCATMVISPLLNQGLKAIFTRERPDILQLVSESSYSFPSGHAMNNAALYILLILLIFKYVRNKPLKYSSSALCLTLMILIGASRVYLGVHYAGDIVGGWLFGCAVAVAVYLIWDSRYAPDNK
jgi:undecaprenyl-diphosphatase